MLTKEELLKSGVPQSCIDYNDRTQKVYDFAHELIRNHVPNAPIYLQVAMTQELLLRAGGKR